MPPTVSPWDKPAPMPWGEWGEHEGWSLQHPHVLIMGSLDDALKIAAADEMLEALELTLRDDAEGLSHFNEVLAVIAKARGMSDRK